MKNILIGINAVLLIAVCILFYLYFSLKTTLSNSPAISGNNPLPQPKIVTDPAKLKDAKIAYINIDSLDLKYEYISDYSKKVRAQQSAIEAQMNSMAARFQQRYADFQSAVQAGIRSEADLKKEQAELEQMQYDIAAKEKVLQNLAEEVAAKQGEMLKNVNAFIARYSHGKFDYILAYTNNISSVLYAKPDLEITQEIIDGLNAEYRQSKGKK